MVKESTEYAEIENLYKNSRDYLETCINGEKVRDKEMFRFYKRKNKNLNGLVMGIALGVNLFFWGYLGYCVSSSLHNKGYSKEEIKSARFVEKEDEFDPVRFATWYGRELYFLTHNIK
jgi:hypothetical protein